MVKGYVVAQYYTDFLSRDWQHFGENPKVHVTMYHCSNFRLLIQSKRIWQLNKCGNQVFFQTLMFFFG